VLYITCLYSFLICYVLFEILSSENHNLGASIHLKKFKSKMSLLPETLVAGLQATLFGKHRHLAEVQFIVIFYVIFCGMYCTVYTVHVFWNLTPIKLFDFNVLYWYLVLEFVYGICRQIFIDTFWDNKLKHELQVMEFLFFCQITYCQMNWLYDQLFHLS